MSLSHLIDELGGVTAVARACGVSSQAVSNWKAKGKAPVCQHLPLWRLAAARGVEWTPPGCEGLALITRSQLRRITWREAAA